MIQNILKPKSLPKKSLLLLIAISITISSHALKADKDKILKITADAVDVLYKEKKTIMKGNAVIIQGSTKLIGEKVIIYYDKDNKLEKIFAYGAKNTSNKNKQAQYHTILDKNNSPFTATADIIEYFNKKKLAKFLGNAYANDGTNTFSGAELEYWSDKGEVRTKGSKTKKIQLTIVPDSLKQNKKK